MLFVGDRWCGEGEIRVSSLHYGLGAILDVWKISSTSQIE